MLRQFINSIMSFAHGKLNQYAASTAFLRSTINGFLITAHHTLMVFGVAAITVLAVVYFKPQFINDMRAFSPFTSVTAEDAVIAPSRMTNLMDVPAKPLVSTSANIMAIQSEAEPKLAAPSRKQQQLVSEWLSKRYHVAGDATYMLVSAAYLTADEIKLDPLLILAVMAIESGFNPFAESPVGAQGLMQVMSKLHHEKFQDLGGVKAALNPVANIKVGSVILKDYVRRGGSVEAGLKLYVGAAAFENDAGYGAKVLAEYHRLKEVSLGRKVPLYSTSASKSVTKQDDIDSLNEDRKITLPTERKAASINKATSSENKLSFAEPADSLL